MHGKFSVKVSKGKCGACGTKVRKALNSASRKERSWGKLENSDCDPYLPALMVNMGLKAL